MTASHAAVPTGRPFTVAHLDAMPDDGDRYELMTMIAPFAVQTAFDSAVQPDVLVTRYVDLTPKHLPVRVAPARLLDGLRP